MTGSLRGKVAIITGAGHGLGRAHAELFAVEGAKGIVVNDIESGIVGGGRLKDSAEHTVSLVQQAGGDAVAHFGDCSEWNVGKELVDLALQRWGRLDVVINNAGILRDRMIFNMDEADWDDVIRVHLKGHFSTTRHACTYWRSLAKSGEHVAGRIISTTSSAGLWGSAGQANYAAAKAGIVGFALSVAFAMERYGVTSNVVSPMAETNPDVVIDGISAQMRGAMAPDQVSPLFAFLASDRAAHVTGRIFLAAGGTISHVDGFRLVDGPSKRDRVWTVDEIAEVLDECVGGRNAEPAQAVRTHIGELILQDREH